MEAYGRGVMLAQSQARLMAAREVSKHRLSGFHHMGKGMGMTV
jgi:hypothetical protein